MGSADHDEVLQALHEKVAGRQTLIYAVDAVNAAETPEQYKRALTRVVAVIAANDRTQAIWRRRWKLAGKLG